MLTLYPSSARGHVDHGWLDTRHSFSFANWYNPERMGFHSLRVINEDFVQADNGFGEHFHNDMEIITYVYEGELSHKDSTGGGGVIKRGDVQHMSAGRGVMHSEFNKSKDTDCKLLQIWIIPAEFGAVPSYAQKHFSDEQKTGKLCLLASGDGRDESLRILQDANVYASILEMGGGVELTVPAGRHVWVQVVRGHIEVGGVIAMAGDAVYAEEETVLQFSAADESEFLVFDLA